MFKTFINEDFRSAKIKWYKTHGEANVNSVISIFKKLKASNFITGRDSDIQYWEKHNFDDFAIFVGEKQIQWEKKKSEKELKSIDKSKTKTVFENKMAVVYVPLTPEASRKICSSLGHGETGWCIASPSPNTATHHWSNYIGKQGLTPYYVIDKKNEHNRFAVMVNKKGNINSIWNKEDSNIGAGAIGALMKDYDLPTNIWKSLAKKPKQENKMHLVTKEIVNNNIFDWTNYFNWYSEGWRVPVIKEVTKLKKNEMITGYILKLLLKEIINLTPNKEMEFEDLKDVFFKEVPKKIRKFAPGEKNLIENFYFKKLEKILKSSTDVPYTLEP